MRIVLIRHSIANYEEAFKPASLTIEGMELAKTAAGKIAKIVDGAPIQMGSSPAKRALATADFLCEALKFPQESIRQEPDLADTMVHDLEGRNEFFRRSLEETGLRDLHELDGLYMAGDRRFNDYPELFEPRHCVANRVFGWLGNHIQSFYNHARKDFLIEVTHAEVINLVLAGFGIFEPIRQCEMLDLSFKRIKKPGIVVIGAGYRGKYVQKKFKVPARSFGQQFGAWW